MPVDAGHQDRTPKTRSTRFPIQTLLRYRQRGATHWNESTTVNISRSGVLFETAGKLRVGTLLEMQILFPARITGEVPSKVTCWGPIIRTEPSQAAAAILYYRFQRITA